ncbi:MAG: hypothetical protein RLY87_9 [Chloroflexota bacterium]
MDLGYYRLQSSYENTMLPVYILSTSLLILAPGANMMLMLALASQHGSNAARRAAVGLACGVLCHTALAASGGAYAFHRWPAMLQVIQISGGVVLVWIGGQLLYRQLWPTQSGHAPVSASVQSPFFQGLFSSMTNVKTLVLFVSFLPQFFEPGQPVGAQFLLHGGIYALLTLSIYACIGSLAGYFADTLRHPQLQRWLRGIAGCVIIGFGVMGVL